jgi:hypothetical protein
MVSVNVSTLLHLPAFFFPMSKRPVSGLILPSYNDSNNRGFSLQNLGLLCTQWQLWFNRFRRLLYQMEVMDCVLNLVMPKDIISEET